MDRELTYFTECVPIEITGVQGVAIKYHDLGFCVVHFMDLAV